MVVWHRRTQHLTAEGQSAGIWCWALDLLSPIFHIILHVCCLPWECPYLRRRVLERLLPFAALLRLDGCRVACEMLSV